MQQTQSKAEMPLDDEDDSSRSGRELADDSDIYEISNSEIHIPGECWRNLLAYMPNWTPSLEVLTYCELPSILLNA